MNCCVVAVETDPVQYSTMLGEGNLRADQRVRFHWTSRLDCDPEFWSVPEGKFDLAVGIDVFSESSNPFLAISNFKVSINSFLHLLYVILHRRTHLNFR